MSTLTLSSRQAISLAKCDARYNLWVGAVRSGKSFVSLLAFVDFVKHGPPNDDFVIIGKSLGSIKRNILGPLTDLLKEEFQYSLHKGEATLFNRKIHLIGANDERAEHKIRGPTFAGAYVDEITIIPESVFTMLQSRLTHEGSRLFGTTNPDSPFHWLKVKLIDRAHELDVKVWNFNLNDNPSLSESFKYNISREYQGLWYQRYILGQWVLAEGTIYDFFDVGRHVISFPPGAADYYVVGVDYGTTNPTAFVLIGCSERTFPNRWLEREYYWDSKKTLRQKTDTEYADDLRKFLKDVPKVRSIYIDPSAVSFRVELRNRGFSGIIEAQNEVLDGIRYHSTQLSNGTFKICSNCTKAIEEYGTYRWDTRAAQRGEDKPVKENDHCFVAGTLVATTTGDRPIESLSNGDYVLTMNGPKRIVCTWQTKASVEVIELEINGNRLRCTPGHNFPTENRGKVQARDLTQHDTLFIIDAFKDGAICTNAMSSGGEERLIENGQTPKINRTENILDRVAGQDTYIGTSGNTIMDRYRRATTSIIKTAIQRITRSAILSAYRLKNILEFIWSDLRRSKSNRVERIATGLDILPKRGTVLMKVSNGIGSTEGNARKSGWKSTISVSSAQGVLARASKKTTDSAQTPANHYGGVKVGLMTSKEVAPTAEKHSPPIDIKKQHAVRKVVGVRQVGFADKEIVYNITVEDEHQYFANNVLACNCMDAIRYALFTEWFQKEGPRLKAEDIERMRKEAGYGGDQDTHGKFFDDKMW